MNQDMQQQPVRREFPRRPAPSFRSAAPAGREQNLPRRPWELALDPERCLPIEDDEMPA